MTRQPSRPLSDAEQRFFSGFRSWQTAHAPGAGVRDLIDRLARFETYLARAGRTDTVDMLDATRALLRLLRESTDTPIVE